MPASYTHIYFGQKVYEKLDKNIKELIHPYKKYYMMGLFGPDPLFFYKAYKRNKINDYGDLLHSQDAYLFFEKARTIIAQQTHKEPYIAYICGFMNHFILDSEVHKYVSQYEDIYHVSHGKIEADLDRYLLVKEGYKASATSYTRHIYNHQDVAEVMSVFLDIDTKTMYKAISHMKLFLNVFHCPTSMKLYCVQKGLDLLNLTHIQDMIIVDNEDPRCKIPSQVLSNMLDNSIPLSTKNIKDYYDLLNTSLPLSSRLHQNFN